jgi:hypothetical protein
VVLGGIEQKTSNTRRAPGADTAWYLRTLQGWGHPLCPVGRIAEEAWLRAEADADFWYFQARDRNLPEAPG